MLGKRLNCIYTGRRDFDVPVNLLDISLAKETLQWQPEHSLRQGLAKTIQWIQTNC